MYKGAAQPIFIYMVYVKRKDFDLAKEVLNLR